MKPMCAFMGEYQGGTGQLIDQKSIEIILTLPFIIYVSLLTVMYEVECTVSQCE